MRQLEPQHVGSYQGSHHRLSEECHRPSNFTLAVNMCCIQMHNLVVAALCYLDQLAWCSEICFCRLPETSEAELFWWTIIIFPDGGYICVCHAAGT